MPKLPLDELRHKEPPIDPYLHVIGVFLLFCIAATLMYFGFIE
jgi:hypothetical protein